MSFRRPVLGLDGLYDSPPANLAVDVAIDRALFLKRVRSYNKFKCSQTLPSCEHLICESNQFTRY